MAVLDLVAATSESCLPSENPSTGEVFGTVPDSDIEDVNNAVAGARRAFPLWSQSTEKRFDYS